jgi:hypothetical protein
MGVCPVSRTASSPTRLHASQMRANLSLNAGARIHDLHPRGGLPVSW